MPTADTAATKTPEPSAFAARPGSATRRFEGVRFSEQIDVGQGLALELRSVGLMRYKGLFRGFAAALYLEADTRSRDASADVPKRLELAYFLPIAGRLLGPAGRTVMRKGMSRTALGELEDRLRQIDGAYLSVKAGDRYSLTYLPGHGTELALNGRSLTVVQGEDFAQAYFGIWLGPSPMDRRLRDQLTA